jgi:hypothetical protein
MWKRIKFYAVMIVIGALAVTALYYRYLALAGHGKIVRTLDSSAVVQQIQQLSELVTVRYTIQKAIGLKEEKVPFGSESVMMLVQAQALAGVDLAALRSNDVAVVPGNNVLIRLPAARLLHVFIDDKQTQVWDRSKTIFVSSNPQLEQNARQAALESVRQAAVEAGILSNAQHNAETVVRGFLKSVGVESVSFR